MRVCFYSTSKTWGGGEQLLANLVDAIQPLGVEPIIAARRGGSVARWARMHALPLFESPGRGRDPFSMGRLRRWLARQGAELALLNDPHAITSGGLATLGMGIPRVGIRHTTFRLRSAWKHNWLLDHVACVSGPARQNCIDAGVSPEQCSVVHGGVPTGPSGTGPTPRPKFDSSDERVLLAVGSLLPVKGFDTILHALSHSDPDGDAMRLWIAGEGPLELELRTLAHQLNVADRVQWLGRRSDIAELMAAADLFVSASHSEGLSLVLIEAMLAGCPIVSTAVGGAGEVLDADQLGNSPYAKTFAPGDPEGLMMAINASLADSSPQQIASARQWASKSFSAERMARDHVRLYESLLGRASVDASAAATRAA